MRISTFLPFAIFAGTGCGDTTAPKGGTGTPALRISGSWTYTVTATDQGMMATCQANGTVTFSQTDTGDQFGGGLAGMQTCIDGGVSTGAQTVIVPVSAGELAGAAVKFVALGCTHVGSVTGSPPNHFTGTVSCSLAVTEGGTPRPFTGTWEATR